LLKNYYFNCRNLHFFFSEYLDALDFKIGVSYEKKSSKFLTNIAR
jgi:hypothetical protein